MPLTGAQITQLAKEFEMQWDLPTLTLFTSNHLNINLGNMAPDGDFYNRAVKLLTALSCEIPPRDNELLEKLLTCQNARLRNIAGELLIPPFFSPTNDPHDAILLGKEAFVDRAELREQLRDFTKASRNSTRVLIVRGDEPGGKSYSYTFLHHLAAHSAGATTKRLRLSGTSYTPRQLMEQIFHLLGLNLSKLPRMADDPQLASIRPLINAFMGQVVNLQRPYWLAIDDINDPTVTPSIRDVIYAIACSVESDKPENLWVALLGYNAEIIDGEMRWIAQDDARFPDAACLAKHFQFMADAGPIPLSAQEAHHYADVLLTKFPELTKEAMTRLTPLIEDIGDKLRQGKRP